MRTIESGKHTGKILANCPVEYLEWASKHEKNFAERNRWISRDAKIILERAKCPERKEKKMTKILIETGSESHTSSSLSVQAKFVGGKLDGEPMWKAKNLIVNTKWYPRDRHSSYCENIWELPDGTQFEIICKREDGVWYHNVYEVDSSQEVTDMKFACGKRDIDFKGRVRLVKDVLAAKKAASEAARTEGF